MMKQIIPNSELIARCGLYCGACKRYLNEKCPGCTDNSKASWCKIRTCCMDKQIANCSECNEYTNVAECKLRSGFMTNIFSLVFNSDRNACIEAIKENGADQFSIQMVEINKPSLPRKRK